MLNSVFTMINAKVMDHRKATGVAEDAPISHLDITTLPPVFTAIKWIAETCEAIRQNPQAEIKLPEAINEKTAVSKFDLAAGLTFQQAMEVYGLAIKTAVEMASDSLEEMPRMHIARIENLANRINKGLKHNPCSYKVGAKASAYASIEILAEAMVLMFKMWSISEDADQYLQWADSRTCDASVDFSKITEDDIPVPPHTTAEFETFMDAVRHLLAEAGIRGEVISDHFGDYDDILPSMEFRPFLVKPGTWRVNAVYYNDISLAYLAALKFAIQYSKERVVYHFQSKGL